MKNIGPYEEIVRFCQSVRVRYVISCCAEIVFCTTAITLVALSCISIVFAIFPWTVLPIIFSSLVIIAFFVLVSLLFFWLRWKLPSLASIAEKLQQTTKQEHPLLRISLEFGKEKPQGCSADLVEKTLQLGCREINVYPQSLPRVKLKPLALFCLFSGAFFLSLYFILPQQITDWWYLPFQNKGTIKGRLEPGSVSFPRKSTVTVKCFLYNGESPSARLHMVTIGDSYQKIDKLLRPEIKGLFSETIDSLDRSTVYWFTLGNAIIGPETLTIVQPPFVANLSLTVQPPSYTSIAGYTLAPTQAPVSVYEGSRISITLHSLFPLAQAELIPSRDQPQPLHISHDSAYGEMVVNKGFDFTFHLKDSLGQMSDSLPTYSVSIIPDYAPHVSIVKPGMNKEIVPAQQETLWVEAYDDFGIQALTLQWRIIRADEFGADSSRIMYSNNFGSKNVLLEQVWDLIPLQLYPGDTLFYWIAACDIKPGVHKHCASSDTFFLRLPSFMEIHQSVENEQDKAYQALSSVKSLQKSMKQKLSDLSEASKKNQPLSWSEKKNAQSLALETQQQIDTLHRALEALERAATQFEQQHVSKDITNKLDEIKKAVLDLINNFNDTNLLKPLNQQQLDWSTMKKALDQMSEMLPKLSEQLDNTLKYLQSLQKEAKRAMLARTAQQLSQQQLSLTQGDRSQKQEFRMQQEIQNQIKDFLQNKDSLQQDDSTLVEMQQRWEEIAKLNDAMNKSLRSGSMPQESQQMRMSGALQKISNDLEESLSSTRMAKMRKEYEKLLDVAQSTIELSKWQKSIEDAISSSFNGRNKSSYAIQEQQLSEALQQTMQTMDSLDLLSPFMMKEMFQIYDSLLAQLRSSIRSLSDQNEQYQNGQPSQESLSGSARLGSLSQFLLRSAQEMLSQKNGSGQGNGLEGFFSGMQKMSGEQAAINAMTEQLLRSMFGQKGKASGSEHGMNGEQSSESSGSGQATSQERKEAQEAQQRISDQLKKLQQQFGKDLDNTMKKRLESLEEQARNLTNQLEKPSIDLLDRQDRFLSQMLQTTLSMHKQDEKNEKRKSESAKQVFNLKKKDILLTEKEHGTIDAFYRLRLKAMEGNFPDDYRGMVQTYFDSLGAILFQQRK